MSLELWNKVKQPPKYAVKEIIAGRMKGKTDINPQWRINVLTEHFGICGIGWYYEIKELWNTNGADNEVMAHARVDLFIKQNNEWSKPISGIGGNMMIKNESKGLFNSDECYKMAVTDALSVCCKMLGIGADVYMGVFDSKYNDMPAKQELKAPKENQLVIEVQIFAASRVLPDNIKKYIDSLDKYSQAYTQEIYNRDIKQLEKFEDQIPF